MSPCERYHFDTATRSALERLTVPLAVYQFVDQRVVTLVLSDGFLTLFGYEDRARAVFDMDHDMYKGTHADDIARIANEAYRFATEGGTFDVVYRAKTRRADGYRIIHATGDHVLADGGVRLAQVWYVDEGAYERGEGGACELGDALANALREQSRTRASQYDFLTGLPSMTYFFELAETERDEIYAAGKTPALLYLDFSGMKFYNNHYGFAAGDKLLRGFARILSSIFRNERSCRIGVDHFAVLAVREDLDDALERMLDAYRKLEGGRALPIHIGVYVGGEERVHASVACDRAKLAVGALRGRYETALSFYSSDLTKEAMLRRYVVENIDRAISEGWIEVYIQPIVRAVNGLVCDVECLARWLDPERGMLSPASFIPALEDAGLIYKLDLHVVDCVLALIARQRAEGFSVIPHSINLSRSDFDALDIVEEIRWRVDAAGVARDRITIEITESTIGNDPEFMRGQIERFQKLGFCVWMDDFGSGYSSLDILQTIKFDLLKFDMSFMRKLDEGKNARVVLTELMKMATSLGVDTVCEGVETVDQVRFLQEIGCSKLQGYYFSRPLPFDAILERRQSHTLIANENPAESAYFESIGRVNLFDLGVLASSAQGSDRPVFDGLPIAILELVGNEGRYIRSNRSYQQFVRTYFDIDILSVPVAFDESSAAYDDTFNTTMRRCCETGKPIFFDEKLPDGVRVHSFVRRLGVNPVTGAVALAIAILSITAPDESATYEEIARALAADYYDIYVVDLDTNDFFEYSSAVGDQDMSLRRRGGDFFETARRDAESILFAEDLDTFLALFTREHVLADVERQGFFTMRYRRVTETSPVYVSMKVTRPGNSNRLVIGLSNIDAHMRRKKRFRELERERELMVRVMALSDGYLTLFTVDPKTGHYVEYSSSEDFDSLGAAKVGNDFFGQAYEDAFTYCFEPDRQRFQEQVTQENVLRAIRESGSFSINYHLLIKGEPRPVTLKAATFLDGDEEKLVVGVRAWKERTVAR